MADRALNVVSIYGSLRKGSFNAALCRMLPRLAPADMKIAPVPSWASFPIYNADDETAKGIPSDVAAVAEAIRAADGVVICTPEYNFGIPGGLKNALDWVSRVPNQPFKGKPVALQSASSGMLGGARSQYAMRHAMVFLDALVFTRPEVFVGNAPTKFDKATLELIDAPTMDFIRKQLEGFAGFIRRVGATS